MAGFIVFRDGRAFSINNSGTDQLIGAIAAEIQNEAFRDWVLAQRSSLIGLGMTRIDLRELSPACRHDWTRAIRRASTAVSRADPDDLPYGLKGTYWQEHFHLLAAMLEASDAGEPPESLNPHMSKPVAPRHERSGPGWD